MRIPPPWESHSESGVPWERITPVAQIRYAIAWGYRDIDRAWGYASGAAKRAARDIDYVAKVRARMHAAAGAIK